MEKLIPNKLEFEKIVLGEYLNNPQSLKESILTEDDFYNENNSLLFKALWNILKKNNHYTVLMVSENTKFKLSELTSLSSKITSIKNIKLYEQEIKKSSILRQIITSSQKIQDLAYSEKDADDLLLKLRQEAFRISPVNIQSEEDKIIPLSEVANQQSKKMNTESFSTGYQLFDNALGGGFNGGDLVIVSAPTANGKCLGKGTPVLMYNGTIKKVEDIIVGDLLMGDNSTPRKVLSLARGKEEMYKIIPQKGDPYIVNKSHILSLKSTGNTNNSKYNGKITSKRYSKGKIINISVEEYLKKSKNFKHLWKGYRVGVKFKKQELPIPPYILGLWLGDGCSTSCSIETADKEIVKVLKKYSKDNDWKLRINPQKFSKSSSYCVTRKKRNSYLPSFQKLLFKNLNLRKNKHIPLCYKTNNKENRLKLLAGLIDSDGYFNTNCLVFSNKNKTLINDTALDFDTKSENGNEK